MIWVRKLLVSLFAVLTLLALTGGVVSFAVNKAIATPDHIELWLDQSKLYNQFVATSVARATEQGSQSASTLATTLSSNNDVVKQAVQTAFPKQLINQSVTNFLDANYAWLQGKTATPQFQIDLTDAKTQFGAQVGKAVSEHLASLPVCTPAQLSQLQSVDLLQIDCRPLGIDPGVQAMEVQQQIVSGDGFLGNAVLTPDTLNPQQPGTQQTVPYYKQFARIPQLYQIAQKLPYIFGALALIGGAVIFFAASSRRGALRLFAKLFLIAGILLVIGKVAFDIVFNKAQDKLFNTSTNGGLQQALTSFAHRAIGYITHIDMIGAIGYIVIAALIIIGLLITRTRKPAAVDTTESVPGATAATHAQPFKRSRSGMDVIVPPVMPATVVVEQVSSSAKPRALGRRGIIQ